MTEVGIPTERSSYLVFVFSSSSFWASSKSSISYEMLVRPREGKVVNALATYVDNIYDVVVKMDGWVVKKKGLESCRPSKK